MQLFTDLALEGSMAEGDSARVVEEVLGGKFLCRF